MSSCARLLFTITTCVLAGCSSKDNTPAPHENKTVKELCSMLDSEDVHKQAQGALGLSLHGDKAAEAVPRLIELLSSPQMITRHHAAIALSKVGPAARTEIPALTKGLS